VDKVDWKNIGIKELAILVSGQLKKSGIDAVLVGGACVSIYSNNKYESMDLDYISPASLKDIRKALAAILQGKTARFTLNFLRGLSLWAGNFRLKGSTPLKH